jgi:hypothetical protein
MLRENMRPPLTTRARLEATRPAATKPAARRFWDRRDPDGCIRVVTVFAVALIGAFVLWPVMRSALFGNSRPVSSTTPGDPAGDQTGIVQQGSPAAPQDTTDQAPPAQHGRR